MTSKRIQLSRAKGWRMPENTVKVDRTTKWGNPFVRHSDGMPMDHALAARLFRDLLETEGTWWAVPQPWPRGKIPAGPPTTIEDIRQELRGKNLACWCKPGEPCHADVLLELANQPAPASVPPIRMPLTLVDNEDIAGRIPGQPGYRGPGQ